MFIINIMGGLGNQLFQLNFANYLRRLHPEQKISFNTTFFERDGRHGGYLLEKYSFKIDNRLYKNFVEITDENYSDDFDFTKNIIFNGYWQNIKFFNQQNYDFNDFFKFNINSINKETAKLITETKNAVSVHVRCGDYNNHFLLGNIATKAYLNNAIKKAYEDITSPVFFVFSDSIDWAKENLSFNTESKVFFVDNKNSKELSKWDIYLMSLCNHHINSNSSFSWWAQLFNNKQNKKVYLPEYWVNEICPGFDSAKSSLLDINGAVFVPNIPLVKEKIDSPKYTVAITCFNQPMQIRRAISSVLNQTYDDFECIVIDDCSSDNSVEVISEYCKLNSKIRLVRHEINSSRLVARVTAARNATGEYLIFLDGDDFLMIDALKNIDKELANHPSVEVMDFSYIERPSENVVNPPAFDISKSRFVNYITNSYLSPTVWNKVYRTDFLRTVFSDMPSMYCNMAEDVYLSTCIAYKTKEYFVSKTVITNYVTGGISTKKRTFSNNESVVKSIKLVTDRLSDFFAKYESDYQKYVDFIFFELVKNYYSNIILNTYDTDKTISLLLLAKYFDLDKINSCIPDLFEKKALPEPGIKALVKMLFRKIFVKLKNKICGVCK